MLIGIDGNEANIARRVGVNQYAFYLLRALSQIKIPHNFVVYLKSLPLPDMPPENPNWHYRVIPFPKMWTWTRLPFDLYTHFPRPDVFFSPSHYAPRFSPVPVAISIMDLGFLNTPDQFTPYDFNQLKYWTEYSAQKAKKIIAISEYTRDDIIRVYHKDPGDVKVTYPAYDPDVFKPRSDISVLDKYHIQKPYLLFLSSLKPSKNIPNLVRAFSSIVSKNIFPDLKLVIAGKKAWLYEQIFSQVKELNLEDRVIFTGFVDDDEVPVLMSQSSAFIMPSFHEGFGIPVLEAMACGTPVVISSVASLPEVAGSAGIYVDPNSPQDIAKGITIALGIKRSEFVKKGLERVKLFSWAKTAAQTLSVLESSVK